MAVVVGRRVTVGTSPTLVAAADTQALVKNHAGSATVDLGGSGVTAGAGFALDAGDSVWLDPVPLGGALYGVVASGTVVVSVLTVEAA